MNFEYKGECSECHKTCEIIELGDPYHRDSGYFEICEGCLDKAVVMLRRKGRDYDWQECENKKS